LAGIIPFMLLSEAAVNWPVFASQYNWFHLNAGNFLLPGKSADKR
jgi:hypothetical protein